MQNPSPSSSSPDPRKRLLPRHFSMLRDFQLADFFTLGNAACGVGAVLFAMLYMQSQLPFDFYAAAALAPAAFIFDVFDGKIARARHQHSALGRELDSLADIVSFGVAPAALGFAAGLQGGWDAAALIYFVCCGVSRLARFNVTAETLSADSDSGKVPYFEGTPIPTSVVLTALLALAAWQQRLGVDLWGGVFLLGPWLAHPLALLYVLSGSLMISKTLRIPKF
ncbi:MAG: CDP-alcohol phosphatidyltransferase family protein [Polaromonas sp.]